MLVPAEVQFEGNTAPFTTAALDKPIVVSWAGGTFELDAGLAFTSGTCTTQLSNYAAGACRAGTTHVCRHARMSSHVCMLHA